MLASIGSVLNDHSEKSEWSRLSFRNGRTLLLMLESVKKFNSAS